VRPDGVTGNVVIFDGSNAGALNLAQGNVNAPLAAAVLVRNASSVTLGNVLASNALGIANIAGLVNQQVGTTLETALLNGTGNAGPISLTNAGNKFAAVGTLSTSGGGISLLDSTGDLSLTGALSATGEVKIRTAGLLSQSAPITTSFAGDAIVLAANAYTNTAGAAALNPTTTGARWLVYASAPTNTYGGLVSGNAAVFNTTISVQPSSIPSGNRFVFSQQPIVTITANPITRTYDGTAAFAVPTFALTGLVDAALFGNAFNGNHCHQNLRRHDLGHRQWFGGFTRRRAGR
jgi:hypothetical protein